MIDESKGYVKYARDIISGKIISCKYVYQACERFLEWFSRDDIYFDYEDVDKKIRFVALMKHYNGQFVGQPFILLPWQEFAFANIFGWKWKKTGYRVTKKALIYCARKNGKTPFAAAISLACSLIDNEAGAEIDFLSNNSAQAAIALKFAQKYALSLDKNQKVFKQYRNMIQIPRTDSFLHVLSSESMHNDGYNSHVTVIDEFHAAKSWDTYNVMASSQVMRRQPLMIIITTAGFLLSPYPLYTMTETCKEILSNLKKDDTQFSLIYTLDEGDDWKDEKNWIKSNPSLGVTVSVDSLREQIVAATNNISLETGVKTKNLNLFCQAKNVWITRDTLIENSEHINLEDLKDCECYMGVDLSSISDLTAFSVLFPPDENRKIYKDKYIFKTFLYVPQEALENSTNANLYKRWIKSGELKMTSGNVVDYDEILKDQLIINKNHFLVSCAYDSWNSTQWAINATNEGLPLEPFSQTLGNFNKATKTFEMLLKQGKVVLDNNEAVRWCISNCELKYDHNENCKPVKAQNDSTKKIDAIISMLESLGIYLESPQYQSTVFSI